VDSGQLQLDSGTTMGGVLSTLASFIPYVGDTLSSGISSLDQFMDSKEMKTNARKMEGLFVDSTHLSQLIGTTAFEIVLDSHKRRNILSITNKELDRISGNLFQQICKICDRLSERIDVLLYSSLYETPSARLGHMDANELIEKWLNREVSPYRTQEEFVEIIILKQNNSGGLGASTARSPQSKSNKKNTCCNIF
jgi:hypothetical protein